MQSSIRHLANDVTCLVFSGILNHEICEFRERERNDVASASKQWFHLIWSFCAHECASISTCHTGNETNEKFNLSEVVKRHFRVSLQQFVHGQWDDEWWHTKMRCKSSEIIFSNDIASEGENDVPQVVNPCVEWSPPSFRCDAKILLASTCHLNSDRNN